MLAASVMATGFLIVGVAVMALAPKIQEIAIANRRTTSRMPVLGVGARWATATWYVSMVRGIGVLCVALAIFLFIVTQT